MNYYIVWLVAHYIQDGKSWSTLRTESFKTKFANTAINHFKDSIIKELEDEGATGIYFQFVVHQDYRELDFIDEFIKQQGE